MNDLNGGESPASCFDADETQPAWFTLDESEIDKALDEALNA